MKCLNHFFIFKMLISQSHKIGISVSLNCLLCFQHVEHLLDHQHITYKYLEERKKITLLLTL